MSFASNTQPRRFGQGRTKPSDWTCTCDHNNKSWYKTCQMCGITRTLAERAKNE